MEDLSPIEQVEAHLRAEHLYNVEHRIWPSHNVVIDRLLAASKKMSSVYDELFIISPKGYPPNKKWEYWQFVINDIIEVASGWDPKKISAILDAVKEINGADKIKGFNQNIKEKAGALADLLRKRNQLCEKYNLEHPDDYHPLELIEPATKISDAKGTGQNTHYKYSFWVKKNLDALRGQFDLKYWPSTADMLDALADMQDVAPAPRNKLDAAALDMKKQEYSIRNFLRPLEAAMKDVAYLGMEIRFSHRSIATITNCALGLSLDDEVTQQAVKEFRAYERKRACPR